MPSLDQLKQDLLAVCRIVAAEGMADAFAHVSARVPGTDTMVFMPGKSPALVDYSDVFVVDLDKPVPQSSAHQSIYRMRPDVGAVVHAHPPRAITLSLIGQTIRPVHNNSVMFWQGVPLYETPGRVGGRERGDEIGRALGPCRALLQRGHGVIVAGEALREACLLTLYLEETARMLLELAPLGQAKEMPREVAAQLSRDFFTESSNQRAWEHFKRKVGV
ncbi:MAG: class II aldolase/adducin family protein [Chloroflexi bacterium]|nr:class II aldolase/adducin family protein [Chloroflexota bacterium]